MGTNTSVTMDGIELYLMEDGDWDYVIDQIPDMPEVDGIGSSGAGYAWAQSLSTGGRAEALAAGRKTVLARDYQAWREARGEAAGILVGGATWMSPARALWIRGSSSYSQAGGYSTRYSIRWGSNAHHRSRIQNQWLRNQNANLRNTRLPGSSWRVQDRGHLHIIK